MNMKNLAAFVVSVSLRATVLPLVAVAVFHTAVELPSARMFMIIIE